MRCKYCGINVDDDSKICPLCHEILEDDGKPVNENFPPKTAASAKKRDSRFSFSNIYIAVAAVIFFSCLGLNLGLTPDVLWFTVVFAVLLYGYLTVVNTVMSSSSLWLKIFWQIVMITLVLWAAQSVLNPLMEERNNWLADYALPILLTISVLALGITAACLFHKEPSLLVDNLIISLIGLVPIILYAADVIDVLAPTVVCTIVCAISLIGFIAFAREELWAEIVRRFHF